MRIRVVFSNLITVFDFSWLLMVIFVIMEYILMNLVVDKLMRSETLDIRVKSEVQHFSTSA
jgi:hypothetical protein